MATPKFHIHVDAALITDEHKKMLVQEFGLHPDPFEHEFSINGISYPGEHFTKYIFDELSKEEVKEFCEELAQALSGTPFMGLIQCEFIMDEKRWSNLERRVWVEDPPFIISRRPLDIDRGENHKKHELHLDITKSQEALEIVHVLKQTGMDILENDHEFTFTCNGNPKEMGIIKEKLESFLENQTGAFEGKLSYEATAYWHVQDLPLHSLNPIVDVVAVRTL